MSLGTRVPVLFVLILAFLRIAAQPCGFDWSFIYLWPAEIASVRTSRF